MITKELKQAVEQALDEMGLGPVKFGVEATSDLSHGEYTSNVAMILAKEVGDNPKALAEKLLGKIKHPMIERLEVAGPGFINFYLKPEFFTEQIKEVLSKQDKFGANHLGSGKKVVVEYSSPNIAKPFSIGHLRSTVIGDSIANILEFCGYHIVRDNHLGDWGTQFGKLIVAIKKWTTEEDRLNFEKSNNPVKELVGLYVRFHQESEKDPSLDDLAREEFLKLEQGEPEAQSIWRQCIAWSFADFNRIYQRLGVASRIGRPIGESAAIAKVDEVYKQLAEKNLTTKSDGAEVVFLEDEKLPPLIVRKSDGSSIYAVRDLATDLLRKESDKPDIIINEVGSEQSLYFKQLFAIEYKLGWFKPGQRIHVAHGLYRFKTEKMSTRKGNVIWLEDVLDEAVKKIKEISQDIPPEVAEEVGIGAIKFNDLRREAKLDVVFDWDVILNIKGDSGPYLQYTFARTQSVLIKAKENNIETKVKTAEAPGEVEKLLARFPEVVYRAGEFLAPHFIATYLIELASAFNAFYANNKIVSEEENSAYRVALTAAVGQVLKNGLDLLGIAAPEKM